MFVFVCLLDWHVQSLLQIVIKKARNASEITEVGTQKITEYASRGFRALGVAKGSADGPISGVQWEAVGLLPLYDPPRHDTGETIRRCIQKVTSSYTELSLCEPRCPLLHVAYCWGLCA